MLEPSASALITAICLSVFSTFAMRITVLHKLAIVKGFCVTIMSIMRPIVGRPARRRAKREGERKISKWQFLRLRAMKALQVLWRFLTQSAKAVRRIPLGIDVVTVVLILWGIYEYRVALIPVIQPDSAISSSWADLPITARNSGNVFDLQNAQFFCAVTNVSWKGDENRVPYDAYRVRGIIEYPVPRPPITISAGTTVTFPCDTSKAVFAYYMNNGEHLPTALIHMKIRTTYSIDFGFFTWHRQALSQMFTWRQVSGGYQWLAGDPSDSINPN